MNPNASYSVSVAGVALNENGQVLVIRRRDTGEWQIPGGILELAETFEEGVRREIQEETCVDVRVGPLTGVYKNITLNVIALVFRCDSIDGVAARTDEGAEATWLLPTEAVKLMSPVFGVRVEDALYDASGVAVSARCRIHDGRRLLS